MPARLLTLPVWVPAIFKIPPTFPNIPPRSLQDPPSVSVCLCVCVSEGPQQHPAALVLEQVAALHGKLEKLGPYSASQTGSVDNLAATAKNIKRVTLSFLPQSPFLCFLQWQQGCEHSTREGRNAPRSGSYHG